jgi:hypothetical protein
LLTSSNAVPLPFNGTTGRSTTMSALASTRPRALRGASFRSTIAALALLSGSNSK